MASLQLTSGSGLGFDQARLEGVGGCARPAGRGEPFRYALGSRRLGERFADFESQAIWTQTAGAQSRAGAGDLHAPRHLELVAPEWHGADRHAARQRLLRGAHACVRHGADRAVEHGRMRYEALDACIRWYTKP